MRELWIPTAALAFLVLVTALFFVFQPSFTTNSPCTGNGPHDPPVIYSCEKP